MSYGLSFQSKDGNFAEELKASAAGFLLLLLAYTGSILEPGVEVAAVAYLANHRVLEESP